MENITKQTYRIPECNWATFQAKMAKLAKRAKKVGSAPVEFEVVAERVEPVNPAKKADEHNPLTLYRFVAIRGEAPKFAGWSLVAVIEAIENDALIRAVPGFEPPVEWRKLNPQFCDHCKTNRRRNETFMVRHEDGSFRQVGRQCLRDFLGHNAPVNLAAAAEIVFAASEIAAAAEQEGFGGGSHNRWFSLVDYLQWVAAEIREYGWVSKTKAEETGRTPTSMLAYGWMNKPWSKGAPRVSEEDRALAARVVEWAEALAERQDLNDYLYNLSLIGKHGAIHFKLLGYAASMVPAYQREFQQKFQQKIAAVRDAVSSYQGTIGKRETFNLTLVREFTYETPWGITHIYSFRDPSGNVFVWKTKNAGLEQGRTYKVKGTPKAHSEYKGVKQTVLSRCACEEIAE